MVDNPYEWLQSAIDQLPEFLQPLLVMLAGAIPYIEGEGAAGLGILAGINPIVAAVAGATGNILCVIGVVFLGARMREGVVSRKAARTEAMRLEPSLVGGSGTAPAPGGTSPSDADPEKPSRKTKGRAKLGRWLVRFGVPGASILAPLALPTMLTAAFFVASGVSKRWVILWQVVAIVLWTSLIAAAATGALALLGW
ncbi:small multidrug efflux protein [Microbacterium sp. Mcb102]|uniref:small multidrug efflux protein n=1 Tax=Microbacterium sp. Mcb102 TaxID=2926012 RepID=UPI0021C96E9F|nr:small multidrug efflux protein [Microbacterium sp. Mcb102]